MTQGLGLQINQSGERREEGRKEGKKQNYFWSHSGDEPQELKSAVPPGRKPTRSLKVPRGGGG